MKKSDVSTLTGIPEYVLISRRRIISWSSHRVEIRQFPARHLAQLSVAEFK